MSKTKWYTKPIYVLLALALVLSLSLVTAVPAAADVIVVSPVGSIQEAINIANAGDTIEVAAGTYTEDVTVNKNLTLNGAQAGADARGRTGNESEIIGSIHVTSDATDLTIDGFKITGTGAAPLAGVCMRIESASSTVKNNIIEAVEATGGYSYSGFVDLDGITDALIEQNYIYGVYEADRAPNVIRLGITGAGTVTVQNNELDEVGGGGGVGIMCTNELAIINITGNEIDHTGDGIWTHNSTFATLSITGNKIYHCNACHGSACENIDKGVKLVGTINGEVVVLGNDFQDNQIQVDNSAKVLDIEQVLDNNTFDRAVVVRSSPIIKVPIIFSSIQDAVNAAVAGDTVDVAKGTYNEDVTITTSLQLLGAKVGVPAGPDATPANRGDPGEESIINGTITEPQNVSGSTIDGFTILSAGQHGINLIPTARVGDVIKNNIIDGGPGNTEKAGIWSATGGGYLITNNNIRNYLRGMFFDGGSTDPQCTISGNYITNCSMVGIHTMGSWSNGHTFSNNLIENNGSGMVLAQGEHQVSGNTIRNNSGSGLYIWADGDKSTKTFGIQITQNTIEGNVTGIKLDGDDPSAVNNVAHFNNIVGNADGVINNHSAVFDATNNWWGSINGPTHAGNTFNVGDQGDRVSDNVLYVPWLGGPHPGGAPFAPVTLDEPEGQFSSIQAAINAASGTTITCAAGTFQEGDIRINKSVTIQGAGRSSTTIIDATGKNAGFYIDTDDVTIKDLIVKNAIHRNITVYSTTVSNATIDNVASLDSAASGLEVHQSTVNNLVINNSLFSGNALHGMRVDSAGVVNGMTITDSHFDGNDAGMTVYGDTDDVVILNSTFNNNVAQTGNAWTGGYGLYIGNSNGTTKTNTGWLFDECQFKDNHYDHPNYPSVITFSHGIALSPYMVGSIISNMTISNSEFSGNQEMGFRAFSVSATDVSAITIEYCDFIGMVYGIRLTGEGATDFQVHYCNIDGNSEYGISNSSPIIDALYNYWGDETGPEHTTLNTGAQGDAVSDNVDFSPWLYDTPENFVSGAPCYAGSVVVGKEATKVVVEETTSWEGGWNTFSTPILLDSDASYISALLALTAGSDLSIVRAQRFDLASQKWIELVMGGILITDYQINPGEGFFIQVSTKGSLPILCSMELLWPQSWELSLGWNLVGAPSYENKEVQDALSSLGTTCTVVNSPGANPASWTYPPAFETKLLLPGRAYWVAMDAGKTLMCFESTPVADDMIWGLNQPD